MTREELESKTKQDLLAIAKNLGLKGVSKATRADLIEHIQLLDPPYSADPERDEEISRHLHESINTGPMFTQPPLPEHLLGVAVYQEEQQNIPLNYNDTRIVLMVRDPYWLYTYWDINQASRDEFSRNVMLWENVRLLLRVYDITGVNFDGTNSNFFFDISVPIGANNWYIHVGGPNRLFCVDIGALLDNGSFYTIARSNFVSTPRDSISEIIDEEWMVIESDFNRLYRWSAPGLGNSSAELIGSLLKRLEHEMGSGAVSSISSPVKHLPRERRFWLVLNTELIVYGATEPDAQVSIQGEPIKLRPDGTFTLRFALPDGIQTIPVVAQSADGVDTITITPVVSKHTS